MMVFVYKAESLILYLQFPFTQTIVLFASHTNIVLNTFMIPQSACSDEQNVWVRDPRETLQDP